MSSVSALAGNQKQGAGRRGRALRPAMSSETHLIPDALVPLMCAVLSTELLRFDDKPLLVPCKAAHGLDQRRSAQIEGVQYLAQLNCMLLHVLTSSTARSEDMQ